MQMHNLKKSSTKQDLNLLKFLIKSVIVQLIFLAPNIRLQSTSFLIPNMICTKTHQLYYYGNLFNFYLSKKKRKNYYCGNLLFYSLFCSTQICQINSQFFFKCCILISFYSPPLNPSSSLSPTHNCIQTTFIVCLNKNKLCFDKN